MERVIGSRVKTAALFDINEKKENKRTKMKGKKEKRGKGSEGNDTRN